MNKQPSDLSPALTRYFQLLKQFPRLASNQNAPLRLILNPKRIQQFEINEGQQIGVVAEDEYIAFIHDLVAKKDGKLFVYLRLLAMSHLTDTYGTVVLPVERLPEGDHVILIRIFRHVLRTWSLEVPRGFGEQGLTETDNAKKELLAETGLDAFTIQRLGIVQPDNGLLYNAVCVFLTEVKWADRRKAHPEAREAIKQTVRMSLTELRAAVADGGIHDGYTLAALTLARAKGVLMF